MDLDQIPLLALIKGKLGYDNQRQRVISMNVANTDTPGFSPNDLKPFSAEKVLGKSNTLAPVAVSSTNAMHIAAQPQTTVWTTQTVLDSEQTLDGNGVVLEDQMMKMTEARMDYDAAVSMYQQSLGLLRMAVRRPGG